MQEGKSSDQVWSTKGAGSGSKKTNFRSTLKIQDPTSGKTFPVLKNGTEYTVGANPGENIIVDVQTLSDDKPVADKYEIYIKKLDIEYMASVAEDYKLTKSADRQRYLEAHPEVLFQEAGPNMDPNKIMINVYSTSGVTDEEGKAKVSIPVTDSMNNSILFTFAHYGYDEGAADDAAKSRDFWFDAGSVVLQLAGWAAASLASGGLAAVAGLARAVSLAKKFQGALSLANKGVLIGELGYLSKRWMQDGFGSIGLNQYGDKFPTPGGFNHLYTIDTTGTAPRTAVEQFLVSPLFWPVVIGGAAIALLG
jgi:hypothetical protein